MIETEGISEIEKLQEKIHVLHKKLYAKEKEIERISQAYNYALKKCNEYEDVLAKKAPGTLSRERRKE